MSTSTSYRWNTSDFAAGYDVAADTIHPRYLEIQESILNLLPEALAEGGFVVDLGGGSGRLMERILGAFPQARGLVIDQSEPFLALAERRLAVFGERAACRLMKLQDAWEDDLDQGAAAVVSMSAIHHLEPAEKRSLYERCFKALAAGGVLLNGDEVRPEDEAVYVAELQRWAEHMRRQMNSGTIPDLFHPALLGWIERNVTRFGGEKKSGDDCHETIAAQLGYLQKAGFAKCDVPWQGDLWAVLRGRKA